MNEFKISCFDIRSDIVVIGSNPENADFTNPRGEIFGFALYVQAENERGDRRELFVGTYENEREGLDRASELANRLGLRLKNLGKNPVGFSSWQPGRPAYGSEAYIEYGQEDDRLLERREEELDF